MRWGRRKWMVVGAVLAGSVLLFLLLPALLPAGHLGLSRRTVYVDWKAGRVRVTREYCRLFVDEEVTETLFSRAYRQVVGVPEEPEWHIVARSSDGLNEDWFDTGYDEFRQFGLCFEGGEFTDEAKKQIIVTVLGAVREKRDLSAYLKGVSSLAFDRAEGAGRVTAGELPAGPTDDQSNGP